MQRQVFTTDSQGRPVWKYVDCGPMKVTGLRGSAIIPRAERNNSENHGRRVGARAA
ncbi:MAG TPA: hypothetical protein VFZ00_20540 [Solirubrobacter sp.]|nr:hypothetical protein [Solirubrobacter sp.]